MNIFSSVGNLLGGVTNLLNNPVVGAIATAAFPPLGIAQAASSLLTGALGSAVMQGVNHLAQNCGMPKFVAEGIKDVIRNVLEQLTGKGDKACEDHVRDQCGSKFDDFASKFRDGFIRDVLDAIKGNDGCGNSKKPRSWYEAVTQALGKQLDKQAAEIEKLSEEVNSASAEDKPSKMLELQTASQRMNMMITAANEFSRTVGQGLDKLANSRG